MPECSFGPNSITLLLHTLYKYFASKISFSNKSGASLLPNTKQPGTSFQTAVFVEFCHEIIPFGM